MLGRQAIECGLGPMRTWLSMTVVGVLGWVMISACVDCPFRVGAEDGARLQALSVSFLLSSVDMVV